VLYGRSNFIKKLAHDLGQLSTKVEEYLPYWSITQKNLWIKNVGWHKWREIG